MNSIGHAMKSVGRIICLLFVLGFVSLSHAAVIQIGSTNVNNGASFGVPVTVDAGTNVLGAYLVSIAFNTNVIQFTSVSGGTGAFGTPPIPDGTTNNPSALNTNTPGVLTFIHLQGSSLSSPTGLVSVSRVNFTAIGAGGSSSPLTLSGVEITGTGGNSLSVSTVNGAVNINAIVPPPVAGFNASPTNGTVPLLVNFTDASSGSITNRLWDFGDGSASASVNPSHTYLTNGVFSVSLTVFGPGGSSVTNRPNLVTAANPPPSHTIMIAATDAAASEPGSNTGKFTVTRVGPTNTVLTVNYTVGGTATPGIDYSNLTGNVTIAVGKTNATVTVYPKDDAILECSETVIATLAAGANYSIGSPSNATVTITDNELPTVTIVASDQNASELGPNTGTFTLTRTGCTNASLAVTLSFGGTATMTNDYKSISIAKTIPAGQTSTTIIVTPVADTAVEGSETVIATIVANTKYVIGSPSNATVTIADNVPATVTITATDPNASEPGSNTGTFTVTRTGDTTTALVVSLSFSGTATMSTATVTNDYKAISNTKNIPAGQTSATVIVRPVNDTLVEVPETVIATIVSSSKYVVGSPGSATVTITDDDVAGPAAAAAKTATTSATISTTVESLTAAPWELKIRGSDQGLAYVTFQEDGTLTGHGITTNSAGLCLISGTWTNREGGKVEGTYRGQVGDQPVVEGTVTAVVGTGKLVGEVKTADGTLRLRGIPVSDQPDLSGHWVAQVEVLSTLNRQPSTPFVETYELTVSEEFPGLFRIEGEGSGPLQGAVIASSRNQLNAYMTEPPLKAMSLSGRVDSTAATMVLHGTDRNGNELRITAVKQ